MKLFRKCVSNKQVLESRNEKKFKLDQEDGYLKKQLQATAKEYEYVPQEHGYDYAPPSQYVPSHSIEDSDDDDYHTEAIVIVPGSDISLSVNDDWVGEVPYYNSRPKGSRGSRESAGRRQTTDMYHQTETEKHYPRETKGRGRREAPEDIFRRESPENPYLRERNDEEDYRHRMEKLAMSESDERANMSIKRVPTAYSYHSDDSAGDFLEEKSTRSRYKAGLDDEYEKTRHIKDGRKSPRSPLSSLAGWGSVGSFNERWRKKRSDISEEEYSSAVFHKLDTAPEEYESSFDNRSRGRSQSREPEPRHDRSKSRERGRSYSHERGRSHSREKGRSKSRERARYPRDRSSSFDRENAGDRFHMNEQKRNVPTEQLFVDKELYREARDDYGVDFKVKASKKKSRGIFGMLRGKKEKVVLSEKDTVNVFDHQDRQRQHFHGRQERSRGKAALFERPPPSTRSDVSYEFDERPPYRYQDYGRPSRARSSNSSQEYKDPRRESGRESQYIYDSHREDDWDYPTTRSSSPANLTRTRSTASAVPFDSFRVPTPPLRFNPDQRHRPVPMAHSMSKHYMRSGKGNRIPEPRQGWQKNMIYSKQGQHSPHRHYNL